jgi:hypothetical protein
MPMLPVHPWSAPAFIPGFERSGIRAELAQRSRYREFGGEWRVSDTAKAKTAKSTSYIYALQLSCEQGTERFYFQKRIKTRNFANKKSA